MVVGVPALLPLGGLDGQRGAGGGQPGLEALVVEDLAFAHPLDVLLDVGQLADLSLCR